MTLEEFTSSDETCFVLTAFKETATLCEQRGRHNASPRKLDQNKVTHRAINGGFMASLLHVAITSLRMRILLFAESRTIAGLPTSWFGLPVGVVDAWCALVQLFRFFGSHNLVRMFFFAPYTMLMSITDILCDIRCFGAIFPSGFGSGCRITFDCFIWL